MVFQCKDCQIWFRTESKFDNHKNGSLGLRCSDNQDSFKTPSLTGLENDNLNDFEISDDEENCLEKKNLQSAQLADISDDSDDEKSMQTQDPNIQTPKRNNEDRTSTNDKDVETAAQDEENPELVGDSDNGNNRRVNINTNNEERSPRSPRRSETNNANDGKVSPAATKTNNFSADGKTIQDSNISSTDNTITLSDDESFSDEETEVESVLSSKGPQLVCVHLDTLTLRVPGERGREEPRISQVGCTTALTPGPAQTFFRPIKPCSLQFYLENYKMEGDLLKALHLTEEENGKFEFRAQFEIKRKEKNKIYCSTEEEATESMRNYLKQFNNIGIVLFGIDRETLSTFLRKVNWDQSLSIRGILTWSDVLTFSTKYLGNLYKNDLDLEDFYTEYCGTVAGYINTLDVSIFLERSIKKLFKDYTKKLSQNVSQVRFSWYEIFQEILQTADGEKTGEKEPTVGTAGAETQVRLEAEVYSSFRPAVATKIAMEKMETVQLSSGGDSDSDIDVVQEKIVKKYSGRKMILRQRLRSTLETIRKRRSELRQPPAKRPSLARHDGGPITITSDSESDSDLGQTKLQKVAENLSKRNSVLKVLPVSRPSRQQLRNRRGPFPTRSASFVPNCSICQIEFGDMTALNQHVYQFHLKCGPCNRQFSDLTVALTHKSLHQRDPVNTDLLLQEEDYDYIFGS